MENDLFDKSLEYDALLDRGLRLTGEDKHFFLRERIRDLALQLGPGYRPQRILDFGCGIGDCAVHLAEVFSGAEVVGVDTARGAIEHAREHRASARTKFLLLSELTPRQDFDLCHCSGVFHHIVPAQRPGAMRMIRDSLRHDGRFALMENNPWNPGTRLVMSRIPFDADAQPLSVREARRLLRDNGFGEIGPPRFLFWFPRWLAPLRVLEPSLVHVPLGGQYHVLARKLGREEEPP